MSETRIQAEDPSVLGPRADSQPQRPSFLRRIRFPLIVLIVGACVFMVPRVMLALNLELDLASMIPIFMVSHYLTPMLTVALIGIWWLFFSGVPWLTRLGVAVLVVGAFATFRFVLIRKFELTTGPIGLVPRVEYIWEPSPEEHLAQFLKKELTSSTGLPPIDATVGSEDFAAYRGARRDGVVSLTKLRTDWNTQRPEVLWRHSCGDGYSGIAVAGNIAVTLEQRGDKESVVCYDRATGRQRWTHDYSSFHNDVMGSGPRATPTIHDQRIYTVGATGELVCMSVEGKKQWSINILEDNKAKNIKWGLTGSPLIVDDLVVVNPGIDPDNPAGASLAAYEQTTGKKRWAVGNRKAGYSSPQLVTLGGTRQVILFDGEGLAGFDPRDGKELWQHPWITAYEMNSIQPVVVGDDRVFIASEAENGGTLLRVKAPDNDSSAWKVEPVWTNKYLCARFANPVTDGKYIYGLSKIEGILTCLDAKDGKRKWQGDRCKEGQLLLTDGVLIVVSGDGVVMLFAADPAECKELARFEVFNDKTWNTPALAGDQLFLRNQREIACLKLPRR